MKEREHSRENVNLLETEETSVREALESMNATKTRLRVSEECRGRTVLPELRSE